MFSEEQKYHDIGLFTFYKQQQPLDNIYILNQYAKLKHLPQINPKNRYTERIRSQVGSICLKLQQNLQAKKQEKRGEKTDKKVVAKKCASNDLSKKIRQQSNTIQMLKRQLKDLKKQDQNTQLKPIPQYFQPEPSQKLNEPVSIDIFDYNKLSQNLTDYQKKWLELLLEKTPKGSIKRSIKNRLTICEVITKVKSFKHQLKLCSSKQLQSLSINEILSTKIYKSTSITRHQEKENSIKNPVKNKQQIHLQPINSKLLKSSCNPKFKHLQHKSGYLRQSNFHGLRVY